MQTGLTIHQWAQAPALNLNTNTVTFCAWIYPTVAAEPGSPVIICSGIGNDTSGLDYQNNTHLGYTWNNQIRGNAISAPARRCLSNIWSFVAAGDHPQQRGAALYCYNTNGQFSSTNPVHQRPGGNLLRH